MNIEALDPAAFDGRDRRARQRSWRTPSTAAPAVNFLAGVTPAEATAWWAARVDGRRGRRDHRRSWRDDGDRIVGSTLLERSRNPNSPHRAEIGKVIVHRSARRQGLGRALMEAAEERARSEGRWMLVLDTVTGSPAEALYGRSAGTTVGTMPDYALDTGRRPGSRDLLLEGPAVSRRTVLIAPDSFKGSLTSVQVARALADGWLRARPDDEILLCPLADGGEGTLAAIEAAGGWTWRPRRVHDPLGRPIMRGG